MYDGIKTKEQKKSDTTHISQKCIINLHVSVYVMILEFIGNIISLMKIIAIL